jgi:outer membrane protein TolC
LGLLDGRDYALAHQERIQARCEMLQSQYAYLYQRKILEYYQNTGNGWE